MRKTPFYDSKYDPNDGTLPKQSVRYSFTVTLKPRQYINVASEQFDHTGHELRTILHSMYASFTLIAEITQNCNVHFHGTITLPLSSKNVRKKFIDTFRKTRNFGFITIKEITDEPGWIEYISKSLDESHRDIERRPILKDDFKYFNEEIRAKHAEQW